MFIIWIKRLDRWYVSSKNTLFFLFFCELKLKLICCCVTNLKPVFEGEKNKGSIIWHATKNKSSRNQRFASHISSVFRFSFCYKHEQTQEIDKSVVSCKYEQAAIKKRCQNTNCKFVPSCWVPWKSKRQTKWKHAAQEQISQTFSLRFCSLLHLLSRERNRIKS